MPSTELRTRLVVEAGGLTATFQGCAESDTFDQLAQFVQQIEREATRGSATRVVADLRDLEFATSSCLKIFAGWLVGLAEQETPYRVEFLANSKHHWQRRSLQALAACAPSVVEVKTS
jgi:hypothetical protein